MSALFGCDAPECAKVEQAYRDAAPLTWITVTVETLERMGAEPVRTLYACTPAHAVSAVAEALGLELDPGKVRP